MNNPFLKNDQYKSVLNALSGEDEEEEKSEETKKQELAILQTYLEHSLHNSKSIDSVPTLKNPFVDHNDQTEVVLTEEESLVRKILLPSKNTRNLIAGHLFNLTVGACFASYFYLINNRKS
jgi:hypothetical protein